MVRRRCGCNSNSFFSDKMNEIINTYEQEIKEKMTINRQVNELVNNIKDLNQAKRIIKRLQAERERLMRSLAVETIIKIIKEEK